MSNALTIRRDVSIFFPRIGIIIFFYSFVISINSGKNLYILLVYLFFFLSYKLIGKLI